MSMASDGTTAIQDEILFRWYEVRRPNARSSPICKSVLGKRHIQVSQSCLVFRRVYEVPEAREVIPPPFAP